ncbi:DUF2147 domain-containing protein [Hyphobacterium sp. HN65]|uniref:DUF2147 domain-containing protein n=1 Tax=Hyphobacterium lacteum TaxID=3116575 RepID=A0ABU7LPA5_9PROT|nr:DUF2147 domain-containing protein [Hyphobacterium sp. HN65]MEE2525732.1 DUF2147 domain-containing protein [Hyphobacterium sp. HN65]
MMKSVMRVALIAGAGMATALTAAPAMAQDVTDQALGRWHRVNQDWIVEFAMCGEYLCGEIVEGEGVDENTGESVIGIQMLFNLERHDDDQWRGRMYNPEDGNEYQGRVTILGENEIRMSGCIIGGLICRSEEWPRVTE